MESVRALSALYPRLGLDLRVTLEPVDSGTCALRDLAGELQLEEGGLVLGRVQWRGMWPDIPSRPHALETTVTLTCDLQPGVLDRIEEHRNGQALRLWLHLWPRIQLENGAFARSTILRPFPVDVPREAWLRALEGLEYGRVDLIEVRFALEGGEEMRAAAQALRSAQQQLERGDWTQALGHVRFIVEALERGRGRLPDFLKTELGAHGAHWAAIAAQLKQITHIPHHGFGQSVQMLRAEARGAVRIAASLLELVSDLLARRAAGGALTQALSRIAERDPAASTIDVGAARSDASDGER